MTPSMGSVLYFSGQQLHGGAPVLRGVRYILAGFCEYESHPSRLVGSADVENKLAALTSFEDLEHEIFLAEYNSTHDGAAADAGFRTGDLIVGIECLRTGTIPSNVVNNSFGFINVFFNLFCVCAWRTPLCPSTHPSSSRLVYCIVYLLTQQLKYS
jgi:hypothetical protein